MNDKQPVSSEHPPRWTEWGISVLNGMFGDHLHDRRNGLAIEMAFYQQNRPLPLTTASLHGAHPNPTAKLCILLHGLGCNEGIWRFHDPAQRDPDTSYGTLLQQELGYTPFYLRYNTGRPVADNGKRLAALLNELLNCYPVRVDEIALIGHSMGGLVLRSACHYGTHHAWRWVKQVRQVFYLGTPHDGADLEKLGHLATVVLKAVPNPITRLIGDILNLRSQGVKDLRFGNRLVEDGLDDSLEAEQHNHLRTVPWLAHARHYWIVGTLTTDPQQALTLLLGDALVRPPRAYQQIPQETGSNPVPGTHIKLFPGIHHLRLAHDAQVYQQIKQGCRSACRGSADGTDDDTAN